MAGSHSNARGARQSRVKLRPTVIKHILADLCLTLSITRVSGGSEGPERRAKRMDLTSLMEIAPLPELPEEDKQHLRRLDWHQIRASVAENGSCSLGKRKLLLPSKSE